MTETPTTDELTGRTEPPTIAVVGVGNEIMGDDGLGPTLIRRLEDSLLGSTDDIRLVNAGTTAFLALEAMSGAARAVVIDAITIGEDPGGIHEYRCIEGSFEGATPDMTMHDISFTEALVAGRDVYDLPDEIRILGVEPGSISPGVGLSEVVEDALTDVADLLLDEIEKTDADLLAGVDDGPGGPTGSRGTAGSAQQEFEDPRARVREAITETQTTMLESNEAETPVQHTENET